MKRRHTLVLALGVVLFMPATLCAFDIGVVQAKIEHIALQLEAQIERVRYAREVADASVTLSKIRIAEQLSRSEEELQRQVEILQRLKEQLQDQVSDSSGSVVVVKPNGDAVVAAAVSEIDAQVKAAQALISRLQSLRRNMEGTTPGTCCAQGEASSQRLLSSPSQNASAPPDVGKAPSSRLPEPLPSMQPPPAPYTTEPST